ncbi:ribonuclease P protein component [uncultured Thiodictyon sp.]|uniref:ribonuclease P protein component n=1 Tax=uncultured Thiodictyon sp. TaxID=1846217 RepID=UPI0025E6FEE9|nr:ribonuclease P protein component [uncultured Thiodictyon sp.]
MPAGTPSSEHSATLAESPAANRRFEKSSRLREAGQFKRVFAKPQRFDAAGFVVVARANGLGRARLGLAISKRCCARAVDRNKLKRIARESFRALVNRLPAVDIVVLCASKAKRLTNPELFSGLDRAWHTLLGKIWVDS